ncbi:FtsX-like permease family protein [Aminipila butyrica]|uniref:FtsX-like permease family protein n=2 Tax=Aminipila butyrica TaxID=433296 RepID=A0A858BZR2_9FIRM|nr:FtsX-like permease family protein [Aminipila butyrica]
MRAFLTMLGIIIGVASVIVLISLMNGLSSDMTSQFESMGTNTITINLVGRGGNRTVQVEDIQKMVEENPTYLDQYSPLVSSSVTVKSGTESLDTTTVKGVNESYQEMQHIELDQGRFVQYLDTSRRQRVCAVGSYVAKELFGQDNAIGQTIKINGTEYTIVGLLTETADSEESSDDDVIYVPYSVATRLTGSGNIRSYYVTAVNTDNIDTTVAVIENTLYKIYGSEDAYRVTSMTSMIEQVNEMTGSIATVLVGIAGISLVVGGIGIMNIMLVSVTERTREIGIRKALGAKRKNIMEQFIIEAATTSALGGIIGILFGVIVSAVAGQVMDMSVVVSANAILLAFSVSVGIGILFGYFPANKAAKMNPIDALRYD